MKEGEPLDALSADLTCVLGCLTDVDCTPFARTVFLSLMLLVQISSFPLTILLL